MECRSELVRTLLHSCMRVLLVKPTTGLRSWSCLVDERSARQHCKASLALLYVPIFTVTQIVIYLSGELLTVYLIPYPGSSSAPFPSAYNLPPMATIAWRYSMGFKEVNLLAASEIQ